jgi:adhesin transport system outer membrane protein
MTDDTHSSSCISFLVKSKNGRSVETNRLFFNGEHVAALSENIYEIAVDGVEPTPSNGIFKKNKGHLIVEYDVGQSMRTGVMLSGILLLSLLSFNAIASPSAQQKYLQKPENTSVNAGDQVASQQRRSVAETYAWSLDRLVQEAITSNPETLSRRAFSDAADATANAAWLKYFPAPYVQIQQDGSSAQRASVFGIRQPVWTGGQLSSNLKIARSSALSSKFSIQETELSLSLRVVSTYQSLLVNHYRILAAKKGIRLLERYAEMMDRRVHAGVSAPIEQSLVNSRLLQTRTDLDSYKAAHRTALAQLSQLVGQSFMDADIIYLTDASMEKPLDPEDLMIQAVTVNPVLARLKEDINTAKHQKEYERAVLFPTISINAEHRSDLYAGSSSSSQNLVYAKLDFSFGSGLPSLANIRSADARIDVLIQSREATQRDLSARIHADYEECQDALMRYQLACETLGYSVDVLSSYTRLFIAGKRSWLDLLNSARELIQNETSRSDILGSYWASYYRLRLYTGDVNMSGSDLQIMKSARKDSSKGHAPVPENYSDIVSGVLGEMQTAERNRVITPLDDP